MPDVNAQERQELKAQAARMAITDANISQYLAGAAAVVALVSPPHGAVLAVGAAAMGVCGNYRQSVANDPPRDDYGETWVTEASFNADAIDDDENGATIQRFVGQVLLINDAHYALLRSMERYDGAVAAGDTEAASNQAAAARDNARVAADLQEGFGPLAQAVDEAIASLRPANASFASLAIDDVKTLYREAWGEPPAEPGEPLRRILALLSGAAEDLLEPFDPEQAHPILTATELPEDRQPVFDEDYLAALNEYNSSLRNLVSDQA